MTKDEETLEVGVETGLTNCDTCPVSERFKALDAPNLDAWHRYHQLTGHRLVWDAQAGNWWFERCFADVAPDDLHDLMARLRVLYDVFSPPRTDD